MRRALALAVSALVVAALAAGCSNGSSSDGATTTEPAAPTTTKADFTDLEAEQITFHAVLEIVSCTGGGIPGDTASTTQATTSSTVPAADGELCYVLGPEEGDGTDLRDAKVYRDGVGIQVAVRQESQDQLNGLFDACFQATDACPASSADGQGYAAIVVDGQVIATPAVTEEALASTPFVITGSFDQAQATAIAAAIDGT